MIRTLKKAQPPTRTLFSLGLRLFLNPPFARRVRENIKQTVALFPADAGVGDAHAVRDFLARQQVPGGKKSGGIYFGIYHHQPCQKL